jgi:hypothetical protein
VRIFPKIPPTPFPPLEELEALEALGARASAGRTLRPSSRADPNNPARAPGDGDARDVAVNGRRVEEDGAGLAPPPPPRDPENDDEGVVGDGAAPPLRKPSETLSLSPE